MLSQDNLQSLTTGQLEPSWAKHSFYVFNSNRWVFFSQTCPAQHEPVQSFVFYSVFQPWMGAHFQKPHCCQGCWADRWAVNNGLTLSFLLYCAIETLMPPIQILPHFSIAELQAHSLGSWVRKPDSSRREERDRNCSRKPYKELKLWYKLKDPFYFSKWNLIIRESGKFDSGSRRCSAALSNRTHVNQSLCLKLSLLLLSHKLGWFTHPVFDLQPWPTEDICELPHLISMRRVSHSIHQA